MRRLLLPVLMLLTLVSTSSAALADADTMDVTVSYRERIALPPDAELEVRLLDVSRADAHAKQISAQRFLMAGVPMTVTLNLDPQIIVADARYAIEATIWSGDDQVFRGTIRNDAFGAERPGSVDMVLTMVTSGEDAMGAPRTVAGLEWAVTEVLGEPWINDDPATLVIDDEMNFAVFGGCNRFVGQVVLSDGEITFPQNFAGTLMACPDEVETLERSFLAALARVAGYVRYGGGLVMTDAAGHALLHFVERPE